MMSQPASACTSACLTSTATVSSLRMTPSRNSPSWPWLVKGSSATSHRMPISGTSFLMARMARQTRLSGLSASLPASSRKRGIGVGKQRDAGDGQFGGALGFAHALGRPRAARRPASTAPAVRLLSPSITNSGQIRSSVREQVLAHHAARPFVLPVAAHAHGQIEPLLRLRRVFNRCKAGAGFDRAAELDGHGGKLLQPHPCNASGPGMPLGRPRSLLGRRRGQ